MKAGFSAVLLTMLLCSVASAQDARPAAVESEGTGSDEAEPTDDAEASAPAAPTCAEGRVATPASQGRCCWPGQGWSEQYGRCSGPPSCPGNFVADGDNCVAPVALPAVPVPPSAVPPIVGGPVPSTAHPPVSWASFEDERPRGGLAPEFTYTADEGWMVFGGVSFGAGWAFSIVIGSIGGLASPHCSALGGYAFIPFVGGLLHAATLDGCTEAPDDAAVPLWAPYATSSAAQFAGLLAFLVAVIAEDAEALEFQSLTFSVPGADIGVGYRTEF